MTFRLYGPAPTAMYRDIAGRGGAFSTATAGVLATIYCCRFSHRCALMASHFALRAAGFPGTVGA